MPMFLCLCAVAVAGNADVRDTPAEVVEKVTHKIMASGIAFNRWSYGCGIVLDSIMEVAERGLYSADTTTQALNWTNTALNGFMTNPIDNAYKVAHGISIPLGYSIGDVIGLFPISYLHRAALYSNQSAAGAVNPKVFPSEPAQYNRSQDEFISHQVAKQYILGWPLKWTDGTVTRDIPGHWPEEEKLPKAHQVLFERILWLNSTIDA